MGSSIRSVVASVIVSVVLGACRPATVPDSSTPGRAEAPRQAVKRAREPVSRPVEPTHPLELLPADTDAVLLASSPARLLEILALHNLALTHPNAFEEWTRNVVRPLGIDPLDPVALPMLGIDPSGPCGVAVLDVQHGAFMGFASLADEATFVALVRRLSPDTAEHRRGNARLFAILPSTTIVVRADFVAFVVVDPVLDAAPAFADAVATGDADASLPRGDAWQRARAPLPTDADLVGFLDVAGIARRELARKRLSRAQIDEDAARSLAEARARGASPDDIADLQRRLSERRREAVAEAAAAARLEHVIQHTIGTIDGIALTAQGSAEGLHGALHVALHDDSPWRRVVRTETRLPEALRAVGERPILVGTAALDVDAVVGLLDEAMHIEGRSFSDLSADLDRKIGLDIVGQLRPLFDGRVAGALTVPVLSSASPPFARMGEMVGGFVAVGVTDSVRGAAVLDTVAVFARHGGAGLVHSLPEGGYRFDIPRSSTAIYAAAVGDALVVTTDPDHVGRIRSGQHGDGPDRIRPTNAREPMLREEAALRVGVHHGLLAGMFWSLTRAFAHFDFQQDPVLEVADQFPDIDASAVVQSPKSKRMHRKHERANATLDKARAALQAAEDRQAYAAMERLGFTTGHVREVPSGLLAEGGHFVDGGLPEYLDAMLDFTEVGRVELPERRAFAAAQATATAARDALLESLRHDFESQPRAQP